MKSAEHPALFISRTQKTNRTCSWNIRGGIDVGEGRDGVRRGADGDELAERRVRRCRVAVDGLPAAEVVAVIEEVEALQPEQDACRSRRLDAALDERGRRPRSPCRGTPTCSITSPLTTGRSLFAPSPLLSMPVVALNGRAEASCVTVPAVML